jgi:2-polyprenyl-3-methyl-5-hydroxy-6-metoxy-1,4-benzoquinol methylase
MKDMLVQTNRAQATLDFIRSQVKSVTRILDIGCSTGILLHQFAEYFQVEAYGIEPGKVYRDYAQSTGLQVYPSLEELYQAGIPPFGLVSMMHVLEHLVDPVSYLADLRTRLVLPGGWLVIEVPNLYTHDSFEVAHQVAFSAHSLEQVLQKAGFKVVKLRKHGQPRSELLPLYITVLAQPATGGSYSLKAEHQVRFKRQWGLFRRRLVERLSPRRAWLPTE